MSSDPKPSDRLSVRWPSPAPEPPRLTAVALPVPRSLPAPLTPLIGRDADVARVCALLLVDGVRLLTLTGPGGVGKTRLAIQVGEAADQAFPDGVVFVSLASVLSPDLVLPTIARMLGHRDSLVRPLFEALHEFLMYRRLLLILDNMEHLQESAPSLAALLMACPHLTILATSRTLLHLTGEYAFPVAPLDLPEGERFPRKSARNLEAIARANAVQLFVARAAAIQPGFALTPGNAETIAAVCWQLDGLPLAIELAAARLRILSPEALLSDLEHRLRLLTDGPRDLPDRLRTMRNAIAWSVDRLTMEERQLFCRLGVFVGGFTLEAAEWMLPAANGDDPSSTEDSLASLALVTALVNQSLVQRADQPGDPPRYRMLETIRAYAIGELALHGAEAPARDRHGAWCLAFAERAEPELSGPQQKDWFDRLEAEQPNMRAALHWFMAQGDAENGLRLACALNWFWSSKSYFREAQQWLEQFLAMPTSASIRGRGLLELANIVHWLGDEAHAANLASASLAIFQTEGDAYLAMCALRRLGSIAIDQGDFDRAARHLAESQALVQSAHERWNATWDAAFAIFLAGRLAAAANRSEEAISMFAQAIDAFSAIGDRGYVAAALGIQGAMWLRLGERSRARRAFGTSMSLAVELGDHTWVVWALVGAAHLAHGDGDVTTSARLLGAAAALREAIGERRLPMRVLTPTLPGVTESDRHAEAWAQGASMEAGDAIDVARAVFEAEVTRGDGRTAHPPLTMREREVLHLLADGLGDKAIAVALGVSRRTASKHVAAILDKLDVESRTAAVSLALRQGLL